MMQLTEDARDSMRPTPVQGHTLLFAIARDPHTIFASWNIDWWSVFKETIPADRQVHLRVIGENDAVETRVTVEPMCATHCVTVSGLHNSYRVEIGYFQPIDIWHSVAMSDAIEMPLQESGELADVDLATIPFHLSFQQLANLLGAADHASIATVVSQFQKRQLNGDKSNAAPRLDTQVLRYLNLSLPELAAAERDFKNIDADKLARRARGTFQAAATSPMAGFQVSSGS